MKVAVIDPVGAKMGMHHYNNGLMNALAENGVDTFILSNYKTPFPKVTSKIFFNNINKTKAVSIFNTVNGMWLSLIYCRRHKMDFVIFHIFRGGLFDLASLIIAKLLSLKSIIIIHDIDTIDTKSNKFIKR